jgi:hypothetical protein
VSDGCTGNFALKGSVRVLNPRCHHDQSPPLISVLTSAWGAYAG